jgi:hypothetical protein
MGLSSILVMESHGLYIFRNISGKVVSGKNSIKGKLDPERISAIINQINMQFSYFMTKKVNSDKVDSGQI